LSFDILYFESSNHFTIFFKNVDKNRLRPVLAWRLVISKCGINCKSPIEFFQSCINPEKYGTWNYSFSSYWYYRLEYFCFFARSEPISSNSRIWLAVSNTVAKSEFYKIYNWSDVDSCTSWGNSGHQKIIFWFNREIRWRNGSLGRDRHILERRLQVDFLMSNNDLNNYSNDA
jgi:hypothetical protein